MKKEHIARVRRRLRRGPFSAADYARNADEIALSSAERFSRGSVNHRLLTQERLDAEKAERRRKVLAQPEDLKTKDAPDWGVLLTYPTIQ